MNSVETRRVHGTSVRQTIERIMNEYVQVDGRKYGQNLSLFKLMGTSEKLFFFQCHHMSFVGFVVLPPGHGRSVTDF